MRSLGIPSRHCLKHGQHSHQSPIRPLTQFPLRAPQTRRASSKAQPEDISQLLATPSWSVRSLLPPTEKSPDGPQVTTKQLHHLLRLSALPIPTSKQETDDMLQTLSSQLHFVQDIQKVDTEGVEPLRSISDVTPEALKEQEVTIRDFAEALEQEEMVKFKDRTRWRKKKSAEVPDGSKHEKVEGVEDWDVLGLASKTEGRFFVAEGKGPTTAAEEMSDGTDRK